MTAGDKKVLAGIILYGLAVGLIVLIAVRTCAPRADALPETGVCAEMVETRMLRFRPETCDVPVAFCKTAAHRGNTEIQTERGGNDCVSVFRNRCRRNAGTDRRHRDDEKK